MGAFFAQSQPFIIVSKKGGVRRMPRGGRKGTPQDSIDSILLAMSRRSDVDPDTLSHFLDRLDEEWTSGAREKVLHLLRTSDSKAHSAAALILSELATDFDLEELEDFVVDPTVGDLAKLTLAPVLKELDSELAEDGIIDYVNDPEAAMLQMQIRLLELVGQSELGVESILEDVLSMPVERRMGFIGWLGGSQDPRAVKLLLPLLENQSTKIVAAAMEALEQLGAAAAEESIRALTYLLNSSTNRQVKQQARAVLGAGAPASKESAPVMTMLEPLHFDAQTAELAARGDELYKLPEFDPWLFEPFASLHPYVHNYLNLSGQHNLTPGRKRKTPPRPTETQRRQQEVLVDTVME